MSARRSPVLRSNLEAIGNTPLVRLNKVVPQGSADVYVKLEQFNPTCSYKDRMALAMIEEAEKRGDLSPGMTVVEYTGGSTGSSLAFVCAVKGYRFKVVSSDAFAEEKLKTMQAFGADVHLVPSKGGKITPDLVPRMIEKAEEFARSDDTYFTNQLHNRDTLVGYEQIGRELLNQIDRPIDVYCGAVGTAGMLMGVSRVLKGAMPGTKVVGFEPAASAVISTGVAGEHHVEGTGIGFIPPLLDEEYYDEMRGIDEAAGREMARRLAREEGIFAGISSGLNVAGALQLAQEIGQNKTVVTVAVDSGLKYLAGELYDV
jgi:cysteine synthase A